MTDQVGAIFAALYYAIPLAIVVLLFLKLFQGKRLAVGQLTLALLVWAFGLLIALFALGGCMTGHCGDRHEEAFSLAIVVTINCLAVWIAYMAARKK
ncbi:MAG: hypothetical protein QM776_14040 [Rhodocyclaceae bacterium]